jgi:hypothetical protein
MDMASSYFSEKTAENMTKKHNWTLFPVVCSLHFCQDLTGTTVQLLPFTNAELENLGLFGRRSTRTPFRLLLVPSFSPLPFLMATA